MEDSGINTVIVKALMSLRGMTPETMASVLQVRVSDLLRWLEKDDETALPVHRQMEVLDMLGVRGHSLRPDVVHYWTVHEPVFGRARKIYAALDVLAEAFGAAEVVYLSQESDPAFSLSAKAHFGLKFPNFYAILEVQGSPFFNIKFSPSVSPKLSWMEGSIGLLMENRAYRALEPGAVQPEDLSGQVESVQDQIKWEQLSELAKTVKVSPEQLAAIVQKVANNQLTFSPSADAPVAEQSTVQEPAPVAAPATPQPALAPTSARTGSFSFVR